MLATIVSGSAIVRDALERAARDHFEIIKKRANFDATDDVDPTVDVIFFDVANPDVDVAAILHIKDRVTLSRIIVITRENQNIKQFIQLVGKVGAILPHTLTVEEITLAARIVRDGLTVVPTSLLPLLREDLSDRGGTPLAGLSLTDREESVLALMAEGHSNKMIARSLGINDTTVRVHVRSVLHKMGVNNRTQAALFVLKSRSGSSG